MRLVGITIMVLGLASACSSYVSREECRREVSMVGDFCSDAMKELTEVCVKAKKKAFENGAMSCKGPKF